MSRRVARCCSITRVATTATAGNAAMAAPVSGFFWNTASSGCISRTSPSQIGQIAGSTMPNGPRAQAGSISSRTAAVRLAAPAMAKTRVARS